MTLTYIYTTHSHQNKDSKMGHLPFDLAIKTAPDGGNLRLLVFVTDAISTTLEGQFGHVFL